LLGSQNLFFIRTLLMSAIVSEMYPQRDGHGEPPNVVQKAMRLVLLCMDRHSWAVMPDR
jgi:hypothetical protein